MTKRFPKMMKRTKKLPVDNDKIIRKGKYIRKIRPTSTKLERRKNSKRITKERKTIPKTIDHENELNATSPEPIILIRPILEDDDDGEYASSQEYDIYDLYTYADFRRAEDYLDTGYEAPAMLQDLCYYLSQFRE
jgi:hypothetical protein